MTLELMVSAIGKPSGLDLNHKAKFWILARGHIDFEAITYQFTTA